MTKHSGGPALSEILRQLADDVARERVSIGDLLTALADRALAALLFVFACPNVLPTLPGTSAILGAPLVILAAQLAFARKPWLPAFIATRSMARTDFQALIGRIIPWLQRAERMLRPRGSAWALPPMEYLVGLVCLLLAIVVLLPIPLGNMLPAAAISMLALGILERDGLWIVAGLVTAAVSAVLVSGVIFAAIKAMLFIMMNF
ncbi:exopolysaccharide biosynthesis protein [Pseudoduganella lutea]|uniref:Exopolysaccharide biosynthesis protein n=1 Tax=Pseudoduganella lutea TaxID=321985 RepID=A0A4P6L1X0_9BURK|nr:exopolysaccharide biosynthesis protein [Pseudoduganella lutea]QBE65439.1 exopolysaccharide biosynthesis protein [Pseudoduganella lutea]